MMEVITKGSVDFAEGSGSSDIGTQSRSTTSHSVRTDSQLSLECLPPEIPYYSSNGLPTHNHSTSVNENSVPGDNQIRLHSWNASDPEEGAHSSHVLYDQIQELSGRLHTQLGAVQDVAHEEMGSSSSLSSEHNGCLSVDSSPVSGQTSYSTEQLSSRNSTLVGEGSLNSSSEDLSVEDADLDDNKDCDVNSCAIVVHPETSIDVSTSMSSGELHEGLEYNVGELDSDGSDRHSRDSNGDKWVGNKIPPGNNMDPKLYKALEKMRKLDERLANITKKEREVKRQRKLLEQQLGIVGGGPVAGDEGQSSTALVPIDDCEENSAPTSPVFVTRLDDNSSSAGDMSERTCSGSLISVGVRDGEEERPGKEGGKRMEKHRGKKEQHARGHQDNPHGTNFIKRNIELASEAGAAVSMTESEKKRLEELLSDSAEMEDPYDSTAVVGAIEEGGFSYSQEDLDKMRDIDSRLQLMLPPCDWESTSRNITSAVSSHEHQLDSHAPCSHVDREDSSSLGPASSSSTVEEARHIVPGEEVLHHFQISREESKRLKDIEERLLAIKEENERISQALVPLPLTDLQTLLDQCTRELQCGSQYTCRLPSSSRLSKTTLHKETDLGVDVV